MQAKNRPFTALLLGTFLGIFGAVGSGVAVAQPAPGIGGMAANPPAWPQMGDLQKMTPAERQAALKQIINQTMRDTLKGIGVVDEPTQSTILQFVDAQEEAKQSVRQKARLLSQALLDNTRTGEQVAALTQELRKAVDDAKAARKEDVATLEELTAFSKQPKLEALLTMLGLIGDETVFLQGVVGNYINTISILMEPPVAPAAPENPQQQ